MEGTHRQIAQDRVPLPRIYKVWNVPEWGSADADYLRLASSILTSGKNSRLYKRLVYEDQIATDVSTFLDAREIGGQFYITATAQQGVDLKIVEDAIDEELAKFLKKGPSRKEVERVQTRSRARFIRGIERIGGFGGKSDILVRNEVFGGRPDFYKTTMDRINSATRKDILEAAQRWLSDGVYILEIHPFPDYSTIETDADRSKLPETGEFPKLVLPELQHATLPNGLEIILAERHDIPVVNFRLVVDAGYAADQFGLAGTASMTMSMLDEGTKSRRSLEISAELDELGASQGAWADLDVCSVSLSALKENLKESLVIYADVLLYPAFPEAELERLKKQRLAGIKQEESRPMSMAFRLLPKLLYGEGHAYSNPLTGTGTAATTEAMTRENLMEFHQSWFQPNNASLIVVGDVTAEELVPILEKTLGGWEQTTEVPEKNLSDVPMPNEQTVYLIDKPDAVQSVIIAGHLAPPTNNPDEIAIETMNSILGGTFTSRINMNLREDKHWAYGARSLFWDAKGQRIFFAYAPVQSDKTKESMLELNNELRGILGNRPATREELTKVQKSQTLKLPGRFETMRAVSGAIVEQVKFGIPENYYETYPGLVRGLQLTDISEAARKVLYPDRLTWLVVGNREEIETGIRDLGLGELHVIDITGEPVD